MTRIRSHLACTIPAALIAAALLAPGAASAQQEGHGFLDNLFNRGEPAQPQQPQGQFQGQDQFAQGEGAGPAARIARIENALRQLTGTVEELQHQNQQLQMQLKRMQDDTEYRFQQLGVRGGAPSAAPSRAPAPGNAPPMQSPGQRSDAFDPATHPNAPGVPRPLGGGLQRMAGHPGTADLIGAPGGRDAGAPLDLNSPAGSGGPARQDGQLPPPPPRNTSATGTRLATLPPSASPRDEYDMAYGYVLHRDYALAVQAFRDYLRKHPNEKLVPDANYWLGESLYQQQNYGEAAKSFLAVATKYEKSDKAPEALLRLGQSLAALDKKEAACATFSEVGRKYPNAASSVKRNVAQELKRVHC